MSVLNLQVLHCSIVVTHGGPVLVLPLLSNLFLLDHYSVGLLLMGLVSLFGLKQHVLQMSDLDIRLVSQLIDSAVGYNLLSIQLRQSAFLLVSELVAEFSQSFIVVKVPFVVSHVAFQLHLQLVLLNLSVFSLIFELLVLFPK